MRTVKKKKENTNSSNTISKVIRMLIVFIGFCSLILYCVLLLIVRLYLHNIYSGVCENQAINKAQ